VRLPYPIVEDADKQTAAAIDKMLALKQAHARPLPVSPE
jgi:hypothetical protein